MHLDLDGGPSRVCVDLRASGPLAVLGHDPTLSARPDPFTIEVSETRGAGGAIDAAVEARFPVDAIEPPAGMSASDRARMRENIASRDVLDASRHPHIVMRGRYAGTLEEGTLSGDLFVRGSPRPFSLRVRVTGGGGEGAFALSGRWEGRLTDLGVKPFKALLGALKLEDWIALRLDVRLRPRA
jgi:polyisoprenoid-binding protein YceI